MEVSDAIPVYRQPLTLSRVIRIKRVLEFSSLSGKDFFKGERFIYHSKLIKRFI
jgi:hypothetical protein